MPDRDAIVRTACDTLERLAARFEPTDGAMIIDIAKDLRGTLPALSVPPPATVPPLLAWALNEIGVKEIPGVKDHPRIEWYHSHTAAGEAPDEVHWCSSFVNADCAENGIVGTRSKAAASWLTWGVEAPRFEPGCICVIRRGQDADGRTLYHVAIGIQQSSSYDMTEVVGGNQNNAVNRKWYPTKRIKSMRLPATVKP